jgi:hypothetical protein
VGKRTMSEWTAAWAVLLLGAVVWVTIDHRTADQFLDNVVRDLDVTQILAVLFVAAGALSILALAFRILTWRNE